MQGPNTLSSAQVQVAVKPLLGGEMRVYVTRDPALQLASIQFATANSGVNNTGSPYAYNQTALSNETNGYPMDLIAVAESVLTDTAPIQVIVFGTDQNGATQSGVATFQTPLYAGVTDQIFETGWAADIVPINPPSGAALAQWKTYTGFQVICTSAAQYGQVSIWAMPNQSRYTLIGATQEKHFTTRSQKPVAISSGLDMGAFVKPGEIPVGEMGVSQRWVTVGDGMARFDGANCTMRIDVQKEQKIIDQKIYGMGAVLNIRPSAGDGQAVGELAATIMYQKLAMMVAQQNNS